MSSPASDNPQTLAVFSDIHANLHALDAVLAHLRSHRPDHIVCLGDLVGYGAFPNQVIDRLRAEAIPTLLGNYDDGVGFDRDDCGCAYTDPGDIERGDRSLLWTRRTVTDANKAFLRALPTQLRLEVNGRRVLCFHGSPRRINEYLFEDRPEPGLLRLFRNLEADLLLCGHTHLPYHRRLGDLHLINVGAVGRPRSGDPRACYALLTLDDDVMGDFPRVSYDVEAAARAVEATDLPREFADVLRTGRY